MVIPTDERNKFGDRYSKEIRGRDSTIIISQFLHVVTKGASLVFVGMLFGMLFAFIGRALFARYFNTSEYGIFSLGVALLSIFVTVGTLGLQGGATRQIAYYNGKGQINEAQSILAYSLIFSTVSGLIISVIIFICSDMIALRIFNMPSLSFSLRILSISIPFYILILTLASIFRGFKSVKEKVYFTDFVRNILFLLLLVPVILIGLSFEWGIAAYSLSIILTGVIFFVYFVKVVAISPWHIIKNKDVSVGKELLFFSLPLLLISVSQRVLVWMDTLMLGYFKTNDAVGLYNAAAPLGRFISTAFAAIIFIYSPVMAELYARDKYAEMKRSYIILTKWLCTATLPLTLIFVLFPDVVLNFLFGRRYMPAAVVLQILAIALFIQNLMGPSGAALTAMGKTKFLMWITLTAVCMNIILNAILIPLYGIEGAVIATATVIITAHALRSIKLYSISKIHSLEKNISKPILLYSILILVIYIISKEFITVTFWMLPPLFILFVVLYGASLSLTKSFDREDIDMLLMIEKKVGLYLMKVKKLIKKFI